MKLCKPMFTSILSGVIVFGLSASIYAATQTITVTYDNLKIYVNGELIQPEDANGNTIEPFVYDGTTYLPVRAVGEALQQEVSWDGRTKSVKIGFPPTPDGFNYLSSTPYVVLIPEGWMFDSTDQGSQMLSEMSSGGDGSMLLLTDEASLTEEKLKAMTAESLLGQLKSKGFEMIDGNDKTPYVPAEGDVSINSFSQTAIDGYPAVTAEISVKKDGKNYACYQAYVMASKAYSFQVVAPEGSTLNAADYFQEMTNTLWFK